MAQESENSKKLSAYFNKEYKVLKSYIASKIRANMSLDAEDLLQDVALKLFAGASNYSPINNVAGFVYQSIRNKITDTRRKAKQEFYNDEINEIKLNEFTEILYGKPDNDYSDHLKKEVLSKLARLDSKYRDIIIAIDFEGYTYTELSEDLGIPKGTLISRRHRALGILLKEITQLKNN